MERVLLLVDDETNIVRSLVRALRQEGYRIITASNGEEGLARLDDPTIGVIVSDQRMPGMSGTEFLAQAKQRRPETVRLMLSGYTDLKSVTDAINEGAIYRFLTKPWDDDQLKANVREAFRYYELGFENDRLRRELMDAHARLAVNHEALARRYETQAEEMQYSLCSLQVAQEALEELPVAVLGVDLEGMIVLVNRSAQNLLSGQLMGQLMGLVGQNMALVLPTLHAVVDAAQRVGAVAAHWSTAQGVMHVRIGRLGTISRGSGLVLTLLPALMEEAMHDE